MKQKFSVHWKGSRQPRKQRKYRVNAPLHIRHKLLSANLDKELRKKYGKRNFSLRKGDSVKIMMGEFKGKTGKIELVNMKKLNVTLEGIHRAKKDGTKINVFFDPSNLQIKELNLDDKKRVKAIGRNNLSSLEKKTSLTKEETTMGKEKQKKAEEKNAPKKK